MASPPGNLSEHRGPLVIEAIYPCGAIATLAVVARFTSRKLKHVPWASDDYMVLVCLVLTWAVIASLHFCVIYGGGRHIETVSPSDQVKFLKSIYALNEIYISATPAIKVAALLMYRRIFTTPKFWKVTHAMMALVVAWWLAETIAAVFLCVPVNAWWDHTPGAKCMSLRSFDLAFAIINIVFDFVILLLPVNMVWRLRINNAQKVALTFVFLLGGLECIIAIVRLQTAILHINDKDFSWHITNTLIWTAAECGVGVISVCLPTLRPLLSAIFPKRFGSARLAHDKKFSPTGDKVGTTWRADGSFARLQEPSSATTKSEMITGNQVVVGAKSGDFGDDGLEDGIRVTTELEMFDVERRRESQPDEERKVFENA
ncbi:MAG: hypothetical protein Q9197_002140 [Variospora fuerteventurae]